MRDRSLWLRKSIAGLVIAVVCVLAVGSLRATAAGLADLVPADVGICLEGRELPEGARDFFAGPLGQRLLKHHAVDAWRSERGGDLGELERALESHFEMPIAELVDGIAGREVLLGVWPQTTPEEQDAPALLLFHAKSADTLRKAWDAMYAEQERTGHVRPSLERTFAGVKHVVRVIAPEGDEKSLYLVTADDIGLLSNSEPLLSGALERHTPASGVKNAASLTMSATYQAMEKRLSGVATVRWYVNARAWDPVIVHALETDSDSDLTAEDREKLIASWRSTEYLAGSFTLGSAFQAEIVWHADAEQLPPAARVVADAVSGEAGFFDFVPQSALVAVEGRAQWGRLARLVWSELAAGAEDTDDAALSTAANVLLQLAEKLGPDCGAFVTAAPEKGQDKLPLELAFGLETRSRLPREIAGAATDTVDQSLRSALALVTVFYNQEHADGRAELTLERVDGVSLTTLAGIKELGDVRPSYTMTANGVLIGTSPQAVRQAVAVAPGDSLARAPRLANVLQGAWSQPSQVLYVDLHGLRSLFASHAGLEHHLRKRADAKPGDADRGVIELKNLLALADTIVAAARVEPGDMTALLHISAE